MSEESEDKAPEKAGIDWGSAATLAGAAIGAATGAVVGASAAPVRCWNDPYYGRVCQRY
mgnify:CR=1 FL=1